MIGAFVASYIAFGAVHELAHVVAAGTTRRVLTMRNFFGVLLFRHVHLPGEKKKKKKILVRHAGWVASFVIAIFVSCYCSTGIVVAAWLTAAEGLWSDGFSNSDDDMYRCGNFGLVVFEKCQDKATELLERMCEITMVRGAQAGGAVTFGANHAGTRVRVVNRKRGDLARALRRSLERAEFFQAKMTPRVYSAHTRFATSGKSTFHGVHPHRWSPVRRCRYFDIRRKNGRTLLVGEPRTVPFEIFVTHNGDFDAFVIGGRRSLRQTLLEEEIIGLQEDDKQVLGAAELQQFLQRATKNPPPSDVDSVNIAGLMDLLRAQGSWALAVRYAYFFGECDVDAFPDDPAPEFSTYDAVARTVFEEAFNAVSQRCARKDDDGPKNKSREDFFLFEEDTDDGSSDDAEDPDSGDLGSESHRSLIAAEAANRFMAVLLEGPSNIRKFVDDLVRAADDEMVSSKSTARMDGLCFVERFARTVVDAFFDNDLLGATRLFLKRARGSFGLVITSTVDSPRGQLVIAARGQPMSVAFYPRTGVLAFGSELTAVKVPLCNKGGSSKKKGGNPATRLDLCDFGEVALLDWNTQGFDASASKLNSDLPTYTMPPCRIIVAKEEEEEEEKNQKSLHRRLVMLEDNPLILPVPLANQKDPVGADIQDTSKIIAKIRSDWNDNSSVNRLTFWALARAVKARLRQQQTTKTAVDILVTGCEVSLWVGEQFATDIRLAFPNLVVKSASANKVLAAQLGAPAIGHDVVPASDLKDAIVFVISHSGSTYPSLAVANLLQGTTSSIFVVTSEWDTQLGRAVRRMDSSMFESRVFTTNTAARPAEPCSVTVAATHQLLTQIFIQLGAVVVSNSDLRHRSGTPLTATTLKELERCSADNVAALKDIVQGSSGAHLRRIGRSWADHVLEGPIAWAVTALYVFLTVISGTFLVYTLILGTPEGYYIAYGARILDALIYVWFPDMVAMILRCCQGRRIWHRLGGSRSVVIADVPWVAQCVEAFASKTFARAYAVATAHFYSANPADHFVHRLTHRVARGTLIACGRPDGRLEALTSTDAAISLAMSQAASIQSLGATAELLTISHNPDRLPLATHSVTLPRHRPEYLCERLLNDVRRRRSRLFGGKEAMNVRSTPPPAIVKDPRVERAASFRRSFSGGSSLSAKSVMLVRRSQSIGFDRAPSSASLSIEYSEMRRATFPPLSSPRKTVITQQSKRNVLAEQRMVDDIFDDMDTKKVGGLDFPAILTAYRELHGGLNDDDVKAIYHDVAGNNDLLDKDQFFNLVHVDGMAILRRRSPLIAPVGTVAPSTEAYFGEDLRGRGAIDDATVAESQRLSMLLYESRIASLQRAVAFFVLFHAMASRVAHFWTYATFGIFGYSIHRTQSIMRTSFLCFFFFIFLYIGVASTASPVSASEVRDRLKVISVQVQYKFVTDLLRRAMTRWAAEKKKKCQIDIAEIKKECQLIIDDICEQIIG